MLQEVQYMIYKMFKDEELSMLGFGTMRLPLQKDGNVDETQVRKMTKYAIEHGVNYFDTAFPYHNGESGNKISGTSDLYGWPSSGKNFRGTAEKMWCRVF